MTAHLHPYASYKPSSVLWLGNVPGHWETPRLKGYVKNAIDLTRAPIDGELYLALEHVENWTGRFSEAGNGVSFSGQVKRFHTEDVLFGKLRPYLAKVTCPKRNGVCVGEFLVLRPHDARLSPLYLEQLLRSKPVIDAIDSSTFGAKMPRADWQFIGDLLFPLPPIPEQRAIVRYLDYVDRRIRRYVGTKRKLIALLEEEKQAIVSQAVTRGLDPSVRLKPSGVEWLGDVPEHWEVRRLKALVTTGTGGRDTINRKEDGLYPFFVRSQTVERIDTWSFDGEAVLTAGDGVGVGKVFHYVNGKFDYHQRVYKFSAFRHILGKFFFHYFRSTLRNEVSLGTAKSTVDSLRLPMLQNFPVALPSLSEERAIIEYVDEATAAIERTRRQIELLQEYRTRLIADVVTGKLDVREAAAQLPDESDDEEPIDEGGALSDDADGDLYDAGNFKEELAMESEVSA